MCEAPLDKVLVWLPAVRYLPRIIKFLGYYPFAAPQTLAERLVACRRCLGLSRRKFAQALSADEGTLFRWESGEARPTGKRLRRADAVLATSLPTAHSDN